MGADSPLNTAQPRPPRYNKKTARSMSMPSGHPGGSANGGGSVGSVATSRSNGSGFRAREGRTWGDRTGGSGGGAGSSAMSVGSSRSGSERSR